MSYRIVIDTNILVAGLKSSSGASHRLLQRVGAESFELLISVPLFFEYEAVLSRPELFEAAVTLQPEHLTAVLDYWALVCQPVKLHYLWRPMLADPADDMVLETAVNGGADFLVTFNLRDFAQAGNLFELQVITPGEFLEILGDEE
jgi:putative PIN family toxin of toxin-antitoxin system